MAYTSDATFTWALIKTVLLVYVLFKILLNSDSSNAIVSDYKVSFLIVVMAFVFIHTYPTAGISFALKQVISYFRVFFPIFIFHYLKI